MEPKPSYEELIGRLADQEEIIKALRNQEVDAVVGNKNVLVLRLKETEDELKRQRDNLDKLVRDLEASNKELESFAYSVSHDLRAPLRTVESFSDVVLQDYGDKLDETGKDYLNRIREASKKMSQLINDMLKLSRITRAEILEEEVNLSGMAQSIYDGLTYTQTDRQAEFIVAPEILVNGDRQLLQILMQNLLDNAWKYSSKCSNTRMEFGVKSQGDKKVYFVMDNGVGFDMKRADKLFTPFQRLHSNREYAGTGIGLAIAQRVVQRHGGRIWAESETGKGATFFFTLN
jgi:light-regulated signal transduction histidine kinase (bacteriophytochrome)